MGVRRSWLVACVAVCRGIADIAGAGIDVTDGGSATASGRAKRNKKASRRGSRVSVVVGDGDSATAPPHSDTIAALLLHRCTVRGDGSDASLRPHRVGCGYANSVAAFL
jgi:hypothetical protein